MKFLALAALFGTVIIDPVLAAEPKQLVCRSHGVADAGYSVIFDAKQETAVLEEQSFIGPRVIAEMPCVQLNDGPSYPDAIQNTLQCRAQRTGGYVVRVYSGGFAGLTTASVRIAKWNGNGETETEVQFGDLRCDLE